MRGALFSVRKRNGEGDGDSQNAGGMERLSANSLLHEGGRSKVSLNRAASGDGEQGSDPMGLSRN